MANHAAGDGGIPPRNVAKDGLTRVMTLGGHYGLRNHTVKDLRDHKGKKVLCETLPFTPHEAAAAEEAGIDTMKVRFDPKQPHLAKAIRDAAPKTFMANNFMRILVQSGCMRVPAPARTFLGLDVFLS